MYSVALGRLKCRPSRRPSTLASPASHPDALSRHSRLSPELVADTLLADLGFSNGARDGIALGIRPSLTHWSRSESASAVLARYFSSS